MLRASLDGMKTEWYHSVFMIHYPNQVGPMDEHLFGWVLYQCFHDLNTQKIDLGDGKWKHVFGVFKTWKLKLNGNMIISFNLGDP